MARKTASADSPPPPISPRPMSPLSASTSTMVRTKRPQWQPLAWRRGASSGTVTVVARISRIFMIGIYDSPWPELYIFPHNIRGGTNGELRNIQTGIHDDVGCSRGWHPERRARLRKIHAPRRPHLRQVG